MAVGVERVPVLTGTQHYPSNCSDGPPWQHNAHPNRRVCKGGPAITRMSPSRVLIHTFAGWRVWHRLGPLDRAVSATSHEDHINGLARVAMCGRRSTAAGFEPTPLRTRGCHNRLQPWRPRRLGNVAGRATRRVCASHSAVGWAATANFELTSLQELRLWSPPSTIRPSCRCFAVRGFGQRS